MTSNLLFKLFGQEQDMQPHYWQCKLREYRF